MMRTFFSSKAPIVAIPYRMLRDEINVRRKAELTPWGFTLVGSSIMASGDFEPRETAIFRELLSECDILINVGANVGYYCLHALSSGVEVIAVEPHPRNIRLLLRNIYENNWGTLARVFPVAAGGATSVETLYGGDTGASLLMGWAGIPKEYSSLVPMVRLDDVTTIGLEGRRPLVWVDVEGSELDVLRGSPNLLSREPRPIWVVEITLTSHQPQGRRNPDYIKVFEKFFRLGYQCTPLAQPSLQLTPQEVAEFARDGSETTLGYTFLFR